MGRRGDGCRLLRGGCRYLVGADTLMGAWDDATAAYWRWVMSEDTTMAKKSDPEFRFKYAGREYELDISRVQHRVEQVQENGRTDTQYSTFPSTTVRILEVDGSVERPKWLSFRTATVGCWHKDRYRRDQGVVHALRALSKTIPGDMIPVLWKCYLTRTRGSSIKDRIISLNAQLKLLSAQQEELYAKRK